MKRTVIYPQPEGFATNTPITLESAVEGRVIFPIDQPLQVTPDWCHIPAAFTQNEIAEARSLAAPIGQPNLPNYPERQPIWPDEHSNWLYEKCGRLLSEFNSDLGLALSGFVEPIVLLTYRQGDEMTLHPDYTSWERVKLALTVAANDPNEWTGGGITLHVPASKCGVPPTSLANGDALLYPGWVPHEVAPLTAGCRQTLVAFAYGPRFS